MLERENMKIQGLAVALMFLVCTGCATRVALKNFDQDIPNVLVEKYSVSTNEYADAGCFFLVPLFVGNEHVATTGSGFQAYQYRNLGILLINTTKYADFDKQGQLFMYSYSGSFLTPMIYSKRCEKIRIKTGFQEEYTKKFLLGCFGSQMTITGERILTVLWVPCPL